MMDPNELEPYHLSLQEFVHAQLMTILQQLARYGVHRRYESTVDISMTTRIAVTAPLTDSNYVFRSRVLQGLDVEPDSYAQRSKAQGIGRCRV